VVQSLERYQVTARVDDGNRAARGVETLRLRHGECDEAVGVGESERFVRVRRHDAGAHDDCRENCALHVSG